MVVFNCDHYGALSLMIVLRYKFHKNEKTILLIAQDNSKTDIYQALENKKVFDNVISYNSAIGCFEGNKERANQVICDYFQNLFEKASVNVANIVKVYISSDARCPFGVFAYNKCIEYSMVEFEPGQLAVFDRYNWMERSGGADRAYCELLRETSALTGDENLLETYILILPRQQDENFSTHKRTVCVDFTKELSLLPNEVKEKILNIYCINSNDFSAIDTLVLPSSDGPLESSGLPKEKFPYLYQLVLDYCVANAGNIAIKTHPYSRINYAEKIPDVVGSLDRNFPIEFIALFHDVRIKNFISSSRSTIVKMRPYTDYSIEMGRGYYGERQLFRMMHKLYVVYSLIESVGNQSIKFHHICNFRFLKKYLGYVFPQCESKELNSIDPDSLNSNAFTVMTCCPPTKKADARDDLQNDVKNVITVFFNGNNGFDFYDVKRTDLLNQVIPVKITKTVLREDILADMKDEYIYVFAKDAEVREKIRAFSLSKTLYYTGIEIKVAPLEDAEFDLIRRQIYLEDMETARREIINCLTVW